MLGRDRVDLDELRAICNDIVAEDNRAADVIRRLSALFKRGEREVAAIDINELIHETLELLHTNLLTHHVTTRLELAPQLPPVTGERVQLQQVLINLMVNAIDAMASVDEPRRTLTLRSEQISGGIRVDVSDCGGGVAHDHIETIFDPFWSSKPGGMGIGLAVCRAIAVAHGGSLVTTNNADAGATFTLTLPLHGAA